MEENSSETVPLSTTDRVAAFHLDHPEAERVLAELTAIRDDIVAESAMSDRWLVNVRPGYQESARNLLHYLALRRRDLRPLQQQLAALGLSSLGRAESHVLATVEAVLHVLQQLTGRSPSSSQGTGLDYAGGLRLLADHTNTLLGPATPGRDVRIMVTMPSEAADDSSLVYDLLKQGMDCMRINCAHDDPSTWARMIAHLRQAELALGRTCHIAMDLAGPKLRTGPLEPGPSVVRVRPQRDALGHVTAPARLWLTDEAFPQTPSAPPTATLRVPSRWLTRLEQGDRITFTDARGAERSLTVTEVTGTSCWAESMHTAYIVSGTRLRRHGAHEVADHRDATVAPLPPTESAIALQTGDVLVVTRDLRPGHLGTTDGDGRVITAPTIGCTLPDVFDDVRPGQAIWFDDGKIGGVVERIDAGEVRVRITYTSLRGGKLRADKGINLPDSDLRLPALTPKDLEDLAFVAEHADIIALSFANSAADVELLQQHLAGMDHQPPAILLKIETRRGFESLPEMLLTAMRARSCGVMIARGDLAVECGFERLAEVQEEILWMCEAAHVPVIWATQVLETMAKEGMPSRAEVTDAAMGHRAECVMLNKGPYTVAAVRLLDDILRRMQQHQSKKQSMLRALQLAHVLPAGDQP